jgi:ribosomal protein S18 acetylase RimI-like enzyme
MRNLIDVISEEELVLETCDVRSEDEPFLYRLYASTREEEMTAWGWDHRAQEAFLSMQFRLQQQSYRIQYPQAEHQLVLDQGTPIGQYRLSRGDEEFVVVDISFEPSWRNKGFGTSLFLLWQKEANLLNKIIRLHVLQDNRARMLYERLGFVTVKQDGLYAEMMWRNG